MVLELEQRFKKRGGWIMDHIQIKELEVFANHGVLKQENELGQKFVVSVDLTVDTSKAAESDDIEDAVNYVEVAELIHSETKRNTFQLIEHLAGHLAEQILLTFPLVKSLSLRIDKPWAPIRLPLKTVSVEIQRGWHTVCLGIGSNMGDKHANLDRALEILAADEHNQLVKVSDYIVTEPVGGVEQDDFLNGAVVMQTLYTPQQILDQIGVIEKKLDRVRTIRWGPRTIDVDILLYDDEVVVEENLIIPHPEMCNRRFVLEPLDQIAPYRVHPICSKTIHELLMALDQ